MGLIADGFISDLDRTDKENEAACLELIEAAKEPGVVSRSCLKSRWSCPPTMRACEPSLGVKAHVIS
jgi:hypothetical protein